MGKNKKIPTWIIVTLVFLAGIFFYFLVYHNMVLRAKDLNKKIKSLKTQIQVKARIAKKINQYRSEFSNIEEAFSKFSEYLAKSNEISDYLVEIGNTLTEYHITPLVFQPGKEVFEEGKIYGIFPINLKMKCDYFTLIKVLDKFENGNKLIYVDQIDITSSNDNSIIVDINLSILLQKEGVKF